MYIIVGLGNPGKEYEHSRHNVGFMVIQSLAKRRHVQLTNRLINSADERPACVYGEYQEGSKPVRLLMPLTMMNESGEALKTLAVPLQDLLLVCDDVNLPLGTIRLRPQGSAGGHHGMVSCLGVLGTEEVPRLRIGVGTEAMPADLHHFVLSRFASAERPLMRRALEQAVEAAEAWITEGMDAAMNRYNRSQDA